ncbi:MAG: NADH-quinone oxidoreductase subunit J [Pseudomonadota bacterium]|nr:NADH-quinone oxidoreductase subunit J [Pseudomonadota bacterium]
MTEAVLFYLFSLVAIVAGFSVVLARNPIASALSLVVCFFFLAADYVLLDAHFVAVIQILVYAGAIMVLFIFVIMLLNLRHDAPVPILELSRRGLVGMLIAGVLGTGLITALEALPVSAPAALPDGYGKVASVGTSIFSGAYLLPFEVVSVLLTVALVGAVVLAKREI